MQRILVMDDDRPVQTTLQKMLEREGYAVVLAADGRQGLKAYQEKRFDLVITDLLMPEKDGIQTIKELRRLDDAVKILAISGGGRVDKKTHLKVAELFGARKVLAKPVEREALLAAIRELLQAHA